MQLHRNFVVPAGTLVSAFMGEMRLLVLVSNGRCVSGVAPEDGTIQLATKASIENQYASLNAQSFAVHNMRPIPFESADDLLEDLDDLWLNQTTTCA